MEITTNRFIAFIDIMGFKDLVNRNTHEQILDKLTELSNWIEYIKEVNSKEEVKIQFNGAELIPFIFSDSIVIFTNNDSEDAAKLLLFACEYFLANAIKKELPVKGAIAQGKMTVDKAKSIFFGQPIIDSYLLQEELKYYGIVIHNSAEKALSKINNDKLKLLVKVKTPTKTGNITYYNLMLDFSIKANEGKSDIEIIENLYLHVSGPARVYVDNTIEMFNKMQIKELEKKPY